MKAFGNGKGMNFGFSTVNAGQRAVTQDPLLIVTSTEGGFRITGPVSRILGVQQGDYMMFINNIANIDKAIAEGVEPLKEFCEENGLEWGTPEAAIAIHKEFDLWGIARGIQEFDDKGLPKISKVRLTKDDRLTFVKQKYESMLEAAMSSGDEELIAALSDETATDEDKMNLLCPFVVADDVNSYRGSKLASPSDVTGVGVNLTFTDSNVWKQMKSDLGETATKVNRVFTLDIDTLHDAVINDGFKDVNIKMIILGDYEDKAPSRVGKKDDKSEE